MTPESLCHLGEILVYLGRLEEDDCDYYFETALELFEESAQEHYAPALRNLGEKYFEGDGVKQDVQKGITYLKQASHKGDAKASIVLSIIYFLGEKVEKTWNCLYSTYRMLSKQETPMLCSIWGSTIIHLKISKLLHHGFKKVQTPVMRNLWNP